MSFGALSAPAKEALGRGATEVGTSTTTGDGGMTPEEREHSKTLVYQLLPSRYGMNPDDLRKADAIEVVVGQGAKPGGGGMLLGHKISDRVAEMRSLPKGIDQRSASRHPDWTGPDDLEIKIHELREITDWEKPVFVKVGATRTYYDVQLAVKAGADVIVVDGMQGGTAATQDVFIEHVGIPTLPATRIAVEALQELGMHRQVQLIVSGGIRSGADVAKALALGADAVSIGTAALVAMGDNAPEHDEAYREIGSAAGFYDDWQAGRDPTGISTQDDELAARFDPVLGGRRIANYLRVLTLETQTLARACGKSHVHNLEPEDLVALTVEAAAMAKVPLAGHRLDPGLERLQPASSRTRAAATSRGTPFSPYRDVPSTSSSRAPASSAPYAALASRLPVETRRTPTRASSPIVGPAGKREDVDRARRRLVHETRDLVEIDEARCIDDVGPASRYATSRAIVSSRSSTPRMWFSARAVRTSGSGSEWAASAASATRCSGDRRPGPCRPTPGRSPRSRSRRHRRLARRADGLGDATGVVRVAALAVDVER